MRAHVLLCDHAQVENSKLFISGAAISWVGQGVPVSVAVLIYVPWDRTNQRIPYKVELEEADGGLVSVPGPDGQHLLIGFASEFEVGRPPGAINGAPIEMPMALNVGSLPIGPGRYSWRLTVDGETHEDWTATFTVRDRPG